MRGVVRDKVNAFLVDAIKTEITTAANRVAGPEHRLSCIRDLALLFVLLALFVLPLCSKAFCHLKV